jgi:hypothetical protein
VDTPADVPRQQYEILREAANALRQDAARWRAFAATAQELEEHPAPSAGIWYSGPLVSGDLLHPKRRPTVDEYGDILVRLQGAKLAGLAADVAGQAEQDRRGLEQLRRAIEDEGGNPRHHRETMARHRDEWPALWRAIDGLLGLARRL